MPKVGYLKLFQYQATYLPFHTNLIEMTRTVFYQSYQLATPPRCSAKIQSLFYVLLPQIFMQTIIVRYLLIHFYAAVKVLALSANISSGLARLATDLFAALMKLKLKNEIETYLTVYKISSIDVPCPSCDYLTTPYSLKLADTVKLNANFGSGHSALP